MGEIEDNEDINYPSLIVDKPKASKQPKMPKYHKFSEHNYYVKTNKKCPYCIKGSEPMLDFLYEKWLKDKL